MKFLNIEQTLWVHENKSGTVDDQFFKDFIAEGNTPDPADPAPVPDYRQQRASEYPPIGDVLDAILKVINIPQGSQLESLEAQRQATKAKYPKV